MASRLISWYTDNIVVVIVVVPVAPAIVFLCASLNYDVGDNDSVDDDARTKDIDSFVTYYGFDYVVS